MAHYDVKISGIDNPVRIEDSGGIKMKWESYQSSRQGDEVVTVGPWTVKMSAIKYFQLVRVNEDSANKTEQIHADYVAERKRILGLSVEARASRIEWFRLVWQGFMGSPSEGVATADGRMVEDVARELQLEYFKMHPNRTHCDPSVYRSLIGSRKCNVMTLSLLEAVVRQDNFAEAHL